MKYPFEKLFLICTGARCNDEKNGKDRGENLRDEMKAHNKELGRKGVARICAVSCLDLCDYGPNIVVQPGGTTYSHLDRKKARAVYDAEMGDGPARPDLELRPEDLHK
ncbi:MAG TPA: (2Fe-2S) ferredoxin domain-containing protein [Thermoanaerobaculia bacterium]